MATRPQEFGRFLSHYKKFFLFLGCLLAVQVFLAVRVVLLHGEANQVSTDVSGKAGGGGGGGGHVTVSKKGEDQRRTGAKSARSSDAAGANFTSLDVNNLPFPLECDITTKESISAINRAKSVTCKESLAKTACQILSDTLYPKRIPRFCTNNVTSYGRHLGCFRDDKKDRILPESLSLLKETNSPVNCVDLCLQNGFQYAGVQYSIECFCGNKKPSDNLKLPASECSMKCPSTPHPEDPQSGNESLELRGTSPAVQSAAVTPATDKGGEYCGGFFAMNIYETGVFQVSNQVPSLEDRGKELQQPLKPVRIVFLMTLNGRALRQVVRLIKSLFHERHFFYIHVDARQDYLFRELLVLSRRMRKNFRFMTNRRATIWGGASLLSVLLNAMEDLTTHADEWGWPWDYVINLSESDFPLKTTESLEAFLSMNNGKNFIKSHGRDVQKFIQKQGLDKTFFECEYRMWRIGDRVLPKGIFIDGGSDWIVLHRSLVEYIVRAEDELVRGLKDVFKYTLLPAESFFHTVLRNSAMCSTFVDNNLHVTNWKRKLGCKCQYRNIVDWCGCSPNDFRISDWSRLQQTESRMLFFGRKFESIVSQGIVNKLESWLYPDRYLVHSSTADRYWQNIYHHHDLSPFVDDTGLTLGHSLGRLASKVLATLSRDNLNLSSLHSPSEEVSEELHDEQSRRSQNNMKVLEIHAFVQDDQLDGILVRFHRETPKLHVALEAKFKFANSGKTISSKSNNNNADCESPYCGLIHELQVGLDYDQKEQIFRHFSRAMGPLSEPVLAYTANTEEAFNVTFLWVSPAGHVRATNNITIAEGSTANFVKPTLSPPMAPGDWTVKVYSSMADGALLAQVDFLILPLQFLKGTPVSSTQARFMHSGDSQEHLLQGVDSSRKLLNRIDSLVARHYQFVDLCLADELYVGGENVQRIDELQMCSETEWSSLYPDPKSTIVGIDKLSGFLVP